VTDQRSPEEIRAEIDQKREELADTAAALAYKADVKARSHDRVEEVKADMRSKAEELKTTVSGRVAELKSKASESAPDSAGGAAESAKAAAASAQVKVKQNPVPSAAIAAALLGFAIGYLMARRRY
jgi:ElaB/YqjD/DUF883 family membrane-anchored ribosome-binding protein